jgi:hypothetical protein
VSIEQDIAKVELVRDFLMRNAPHSSQGYLLKPYSQWVDRCNYEIKNAKRWLKMVKGATS